MNPRILLIDLPSSIDDQNNDHVIKLGAWVSSVDSPCELPVPDIDPYPTLDSVAMGAKSAQATASFLLDYLVDAIPKELGSDLRFPRRFWEVFIHRYVSHIAGVVEDIKLRCKCVSGEDTIYGAPTNQLLEPPQNLKEYIRLCLSRSPLRIKITDECVRSFLPINQEHPILYHVAPPIRRGEDRPERTKVKIASRAKRAIGAIVFSLFANWRRSPTVIWDRQRISPIDMFRLSMFGLPPVIAEERDFDTPHVPSDPELRKRVFSGLPAPYDQILSYSFPVMALEGLRDVISIGENFIKGRKGKIKELYTFGQVWGQPEPQRSAVGMLAATGTSITSIQHGGGAYGGIRTFSSAIVDLGLSDMFITWGWKELPGLDRPAETIVPLPSMYLSKIASGKARKSDWRVLFLVCSDWMYPAWVNSTIFPDMAHDFFRREKVLFDGFRSESHCAVKLYPREFGWRQNEWITKEYPEMETLIDGRFPQLALRSDLCVVDHNSTGFLELLAMNRPFMATWDRRRFGGPPAFEEHMARLEGAGVFFDRPEDLVAAYQEIGPDINSWWRESDRQLAISQMANEYASTSKDAIGALGKFVKQRRAHFRSARTIS